METQDLIRAISADTRRQRLPMRRAWALAAALAIPAAAAVFFAMLGPRPDFAEAAMTTRFPMKFVVTIAVMLTAFSVLSDLARPAGRTHRVWLFAAPALLACFVLFEMLSVPAIQWQARLMGTNSMRCLAFIPLIAIGPLAVFLAALSYGAPTRPALTGAAAGVLAGGLAATFYAAHCPDDLPLFVATWYTIAILALALVGAILGPRVTRW